MLNRTGMAVLNISNYFAFPIFVGRGTFLNEFTILLSLNPNCMLLFVVSTLLITHCIQAFFLSPVESITVEFRVSTIFNSQEFILSIKCNVIPYNKVFIILTESIIWAFFLSMKYTLYSTFESGFTRFI